MKKFFIADSMTISPQIIYYHPHNLASDQEQALNMLCDLLKRFDDNKVEIATFMDLSKAFVCVDHEILLAKIKRYGVHSTPLRDGSVAIPFQQGTIYVSWIQIQLT